MHLILLLLWSLLGLSISTFSSRKAKSESHSIFKNHESRNAKFFDILKKTKVEARSFSTFLKQRKSKRESFRIFKKDRSRKPKFFKHAYFGNLNVEYKYYTF